jgi:hypothetical protein
MEFLRLSGEEDMVEAGPGEPGESLVGTNILISGEFILPQPVTIRVATYLIASLVDAAMSLPHARAHLSR